MKDDVNKARIYSMNTYTYAYVYTEKNKDLF